MANSLGKKFPKICLGCCGIDNLELHRLSLSHTRDEFPATKAIYSVWGNAYLCEACKEKSKKNRKIFLILGAILIALGILSWFYLVDNVSSIFIGIGAGSLIIGAFFIYKGAMLVTLTSNFVKFVGVKKDKHANSWEPKLKFANNKYRTEFENINLYGYAEDSADDSPSVDSINDDGWIN